MPAMFFRLQTIALGSYAAEAHLWAAQDRGGESAAESPSQYRPRHPERSAFYQLFETHFDSYVRVYEERFEPRSGSLRPVVVRSVDEFLYFLRVFRLHQVVGTDRLVETHVAGIRGQFSRSSEMSFSPTMRARLSFTGLWKPPSRKWAHRLVLAPEFGCFAAQQYRHFYPGRHKQGKRNKGVNQQNQGASGGCTGNLICAHLTRQQKNGIY